MTQKGQLSSWSFLSDVKVSKAKCELTSKLLYYIILPYGSLSVIVNELLCQLSLVDFSCIFLLLFDWINLC